MRGGAHPAAARDVELVLERLDGAVRDDLGLDLRVTVDQDLHGNLPRALHPGALDVPCARNDLFRIVTVNLESDPARWFWRLQ